MIKIIQKDIVYMEYNQANKSGFTLASTLVALSLTMLLISTITILLSTINQHSFNQELSVRQLFHFLSSEVNQASKVSSSHSSVTYSKHNGETVTIELYGQLIRRQVDGTGHEVLARSIKSLNIKPLSYGMRVTVMTLNGEEYEKIIRTVY
ncbi:ComGF family competence protein [Aquibacillus kalidii]|uniref:ComGF family competence protein n=1 Tax=Aquibacillus kalidii TaxID=2762597 RepID=UPI001645277E|nr:ComGF family competence protein [Aquibacillus kalidii]